MNFSFEKVNVLLIEPDRNVRETMSNLLHVSGFRNIKQGSGIGDILCEFQIKMPDMLISDIRLTDGNFNRFVYKVRHHEIGSNPFLPILATVSAPTSKDISTVVQAGSDDLIVKPMSTGQLSQRIKTLITSRKPFTITSAYIGPDRRKPGTPARGEEPRSVKVPNILRAKAVDAHKFDHSQLQKEIKACITRVNIHKLGSHANQTMFLVERIVPSLAIGGPDETTKRSLNRLLYVSEDIARRMVGTKFTHVSKLCQSMIEVTRRILDAGDFPAHKDVDLLTPLAKSIQRGFSDKDSDVARTAHEISQSISSKH